MIFTVSRSYAETTAIEINTVSNRVLGLLPPWVDVVLIIGKRILLRRFKTERVPWTTLMHSYSEHRLYFFICHRTMCSA